MTRLIDRADLFNRLTNVKTLAEAFAVIQGMPTAEPTCNASNASNALGNLQPTCNTLQHNQEGAMNDNT